MNIFFLSFDPVQAAQWHCDKHVVKMLLETTQLLWTAWHCYADRSLLVSAPTTKGGSPGYQSTHRNHPCAIWVRQSQGNWNWLISLARALADEYRFRFGAHKVHACEIHVAWLAANEPVLPPGPLTWPVLAMPDEYKISQSPTACYKAYYMGQKRERGLLVYKGRSPPPWA